MNGIVKKRPVSFPVLVDQQGIYPCHQNSLQNIGQVQKYVKE